MAARRGRLRQPGGAAATEPGFPPAHFAHQYPAAHAAGAFPPPFTDTQQQLLRTTQATPASVFAGPGGDDDEGLPACKRSRHTPSDEAAHGPPQATSPSLKRLRRKQLERQRRQPRGSLLAAASAAQPDPSSRPEPSADMYYAQTEHIVQLEGHIVQLEAATAAQSAHLAAVVAELHAAHQAAQEQELALVRAAEARQQLCTTLEEHRQLWEEQRREYEAASRHAAAVISGLEGELAASQQHAADLGIELRQLRQQLSSVLASVASSTDDDTGTGTGTGEPRARDGRADMDTDAGINSDVRNTTNNNSSSSSSSSAAGAGTGAGSFAADEDDYPREFFCPISLEVMRDPVVTSDGHTFERAAIESWLETASTSPITNLRLRNRTLRPNHTLRSLIQSRLVDG